MSAGKVVALAGGVGGARLAHGLAQLDASALTVIVNTGDDFDHLGLPIWPDIDTVLYTLAGIANRSQGWGIEGESWAFLDQLERLGLPTWFRLGDRDLATHVFRRLRLEVGERPTQVAAELARRLGVASTILPMSDSPVRTVVKTADGELAFQDYFVRLRCEVPVGGFRLAGIETAGTTPEIEAALGAPDLRAIVLCPSNPYVSIDPILSVGGMREALAKRPAPLVAVSPIIAGAAVKGPAAKMLRELGQDVSALGVARHYAGLIDGFVIDDADTALAGKIQALGMQVLVTGTLMRDDADRKRLATSCIAFADEMARRR
jgi:LPPG:FO 2-phospho-L-lactate transferase